MAWVKFKIPLLIGVVGASIFVVFQNCGTSDQAFAPSGQEGGQKKAMVENLQRLRLEIDSLIAQDLTCESVADCRAVPVGAKACGGPKAYLVASVRNAAFEALQSKSQEHQEMEKLYNEQNQMMSDCSVVTEPEMQCVDSRCQ